MGSIFTDLGEVINNDVCYKIDGVSGILGNQVSDDGFRCIGGGSLHEEPEHPMASC